MFRGVRPTGPSAAWDLRGSILDLVVQGCKLLQGLKLEGVSSGADDKSIHLRLGRNVSNAIDVSILSLFCLDLRSETEASTATGVSQRDRCIL